MPSDEVPRKTHKRMKLESYESAEKHPQKDCEAADRCTMRSESRPMVRGHISNYFIWPQPHYFIRPQPQTAILGALFL